MVDLDQEILNLLELFAHILAVQTDLFGSLIAEGSLALALLIDQLANVFQLVVELFGDNLSLLYHCLADHLDVAFPLHAFSLVVDSFHYDQERIFWLSFRSAISLAPDDLNIVA